MVTPYFLKGARGLNLQWIGRRRKGVKAFVTRNRELLQRIDGYRDTKSTPALIVVERARKRLGYANQTTAQDILRTLIRELVRQKEGDKNES